MDRKAPAGAGPERRAVDPIFDAYLAKWGLTADGDPIETPSSRLLPVRWRGIAAMLKIAVEPEEKRGALLMAWWNGRGAARVLAHEEEAILLERAEGTGSLATLARTGQDEKAARIICEVVTQLHGHGMGSSLPLIPLSQWFDALWPAASVQGGMLFASAAAARELLSSARDAAVLHGDIHHDNILDFGAKGWLAIDPKGLVGERGFEYANLFCNPDREIAVEPERFARRIAVVSQAAIIERPRLLRWVLAWAGLSAAWFIADGLSPVTPLEVAKLAAAALNR